MKKSWILCACLGALGLGLPLMAAEPAAEKPALPAGHPQVAGKTDGGMPAGHPDVSQKQGNAEGSLPAGHPSMESLRAASTQPAGVGTFTIKASQGTKGAAALGTEAVSVDIYVEGGKILKTISTKLDDKGVATVEIPLDVMCQPVARITHGGIAYEGIGRIMDRKHRDQQIDMKIYETTEKQPAWQVKVRHVLVHTAADGLHITEMLAVVNPEDQTWIGSLVDGKRTTLTVQLPAGAKDLNAAGVADDAVTLRDGKLVGSMPVMPGSLELQIEYTVPITDAKADLTITAPAKVGQMYVFIPDDGSKVTTTGLDSLGVRQTGEGNKRGYKAAQLKAGQEVKLSFSGLKPAATEPVKKTDAGTSHLPQIAAGVGGGLLLLGGATVLLIKSPKKAS